MDQVKGMARFIAAVAVMLFGFAVTTNAVAQDTTGTDPQEMPAPEAPAPATDGPGVDQLIGAIQDAEAQTAALGQLTDLTADRVELVSVQDILRSQEEADAVNEALTSSGDQVIALQGLLASNQVVQEALGGNVTTADVLAVEVTDDGGVIVFHQ